MGNTYKNVTVRGATREALLQATMGRSAYLSPEVAGFVVVYDAAADEDGAPDELVALAQRLSAAPGEAALAAAVYDDDVLFLWAFEGGQLVFRYDSSAPATSDAGALCHAVGAQTPPETVSALLRDTDRRFTFASDRHAHICEALGAPICAVAAGYRYIEDGEPPPELELDDLVHTSART